jgi:biopolymer transport protein ExbB/TolQ
MDMPFKINFFPVPFILSLIVMIAGVIVYNDTIYTYMSSSFAINGLIIALFVFCISWILGSMAYFSRSVKVFTRIIRGFTGPNDGVKLANNSIRSISVVSGTLFDTPVVTNLISNIERRGRLEVSAPDVDSIAFAVKDGASRILAPARFVATVFTMLGLFGTFVGLLGTIDGVAKAFAALAAGSLGSDMTAFVRLFADPLQGMSVAFSTSLFGMVAAMFANFGLFAVSQRMSVFVAKMENYLLSNTGIFGENPDKISARDILISLEDSFDTLYEGLSERFDFLGKSVGAMSNAIVRTQERQERVLKVIVDNYKMIENIWMDIGKIAKNIIEDFNVSFATGMKDAISPFVSDVLDGLAYNAKVALDANKILKDINDSIYSVVETTLTVSGSVNSLSEVVNSNSELLNGLLDNTVALNNSFNTGMETVSLSLDAVSVSLDGLANVNNNVLDSVVEAKDSLVGINTSLDTSNSILDVVVSNIDETNKLVEQGVGVAYENVNKVQAVNDDLRDVGNVNREVLSAVSRSAMYDEMLSEVSVNSLRNLDRIVGLNSDISAGVMDISTTNRQVLDTENSILGVENNMNNLMVDVVNSVNDNTENVRKSSEIVDGIYYTVSDINVLNQSVYATLNDANAMGANLNQLMNGAVANLESLVSLLSSVDGVAKEGVDVDRQILNVETGNFSQLKDILSASSVALQSLQSVNSQLNEANSLSAGIISAVADGNDIAQSSLKNLEAISQNSMEISAFASQSNSFQSKLIEEMVNSNTLAGTSLNYLVSYGNYFDDVLNSLNEAKNIASNTVAFVSDIRQVMGESNVLSSGVIAAINENNILNQTSRDLLNSLYVGSIDSNAIASQSNKMIAELNNKAEVSNIISGQVLTSVNQVSFINKETTSMVAEVVGRVDNVFAVAQDQANKLELANQISNQIASTVVDVVNSVRDVNSAMNNNSGIVSEVVNRVENLLGVSQDQANKLELSNQGISSVIDGVSSLINGVNDSNQVSNQIASTVIDVVNSVRDVNSAMNNNSGIVSEVVNRVENLLGVSQDQANKLELSNQGISSVIDGVSSLINGVNDSNQISNQIASTVVDVVNSLGKMDNTVNSNLSNMSSYLGSQIEVANDISRGVAESNLLMNKYMVDGKVKEKTLLDLEQINLNLLNIIVDFRDKMLSYSSNLDYIPSVNSLIDNLNTSFNGLLSVSSQNANNVNELKSGVNSLVENSYAIAKNIEEVNGSVFQLKEEINGNFTDLRADTNSIFNAVASLLEVSQEFKSNMENNLGQIFDKLSFFDVISGQISEISQSNLNSLNVNRQINEGISLVANKLNDVISYVSGVSDNVKSLNLDTVNISKEIEQFYSLVSSYYQDNKVLFEDLLVYTGKFNSRTDEISLDLKKVIEIANNSLFVENETLNKVSVLDGLTDNFSLVVEGQKTFIDFVNSSVVTTLNQMVKDNQMLLNSVNAFSNVVNNIAVTSDAISKENRNSVVLLNDLLTVENANFQKTRADLQLFSQYLNNITNSLAKTTANSELAIKNLDVIAKSIPEIGFGVQNINDNMLKAENYNANMQNNLMSYFSEINNNLNKINEIFVEFGVDLKEIFNTNNYIKEQMASSSENVVYSLNEIKDAINVNLSNVVSEKISGMLNSQEEILKFLAKISSVLDGVSNKILKNENTGMNEAIKSLQSLIKDGNVRLDVIANAVDSLITEMLNSRDVTEAILTVIDSKK